MIHKAKNVKNPTLPRQVECGFVETKRQDIFPPKNPDLHVHETADRLSRGRWQRHTKSKLNIERSTQVLTC